MAEIYSFFLLFFPFFLTRSHLTFFLFFFLSPHPAIPFFSLPTMNSTPPNTSITSPTTISGHNPTSNNAQNVKPEPSNSNNGEILIEAGKRGVRWQVVLALPCVNLSGTTGTGRRRRGSLSRVQRFLTLGFVYLFSCRYAVFYFIFLWGERVWWCEP